MIPYYSKASAAQIQAVKQVARELGATLVNFTFREETNMGDPDSSNFDEDGYDVVTLTFERGGPAAAERERIAVASGVGFGYRECMNKAVDKVIAGDFSVFGDAPERDQLRPKYRAFHESRRLLMSLIGEAMLTWTDPARVEDEERYDRQAERNGLQKSGARKAKRQAEELMLIAKRARPQTAEAFIAAADACRRAYELNSGIIASNYLKAEQDMRNKAKSIAKRRASQI